MSETDRQLFRDTFMPGALGAKMAYRSARRPGTRVGRARAEFLRRGGHIAPNNYDL